MAKRPLSRGTLGDRLYRICPELALPPVGLKRLVKSIPGSTEAGLEAHGGPAPVFLRHLMFFCLSILQKFKARMQSEFQSEENLKYRLSRNSLVIVCFSCKNRLCKDCQLGHDKRTRGQYLREHITGAKGLIYQHQTRSESE